MGGHRDKLAGHLKVELLSFFDPVQILIQDQRDLDILDLHLVFTEQMKDQIQRPHEVLHILFFCLYHTFQVVDRCLHGPPPKR